MLIDLEKRIVWMGMKHLLLSSDFFPLIGGAHYWMYEVYRRWTSPVTVIAKDLSVDPRLAEGQAGFDKRAHGALTIVRIKTGFGDFNLMDPACRKDYAVIQEAMHRIEGKGSATLHCLRAIPDGIAGLMYKARHLGRPTLAVYVHGEEILVAQSSRQLSLLAKIVYRFSDIIIVNSRATKKRLEDFCHPADVHVISPGVACSLFDIPDSEVAAYRNHWGFGEGTVILTTMARLEKRKNHHRVLRAMADLVTREGLALAYVIGGDGDERENLRALVGELGLQDHVRLCGYLSDREKILTYKASDIHIMPSVQEGPMIEGYGIVFLEAAAAGIPSIAGNSGGQPEAVIHTVTGLVIDGNDIEAIKDAVRMLAADRELRKKMGDAGRAFAGGHDWEAVAETTSHLFPS